MAGYNPIIAVFVGRILDYALAASLDRSRADRR
jgi:hypothetical protein